MRYEYFINHSRTKCSATFGWRINRSWPFKWPPTYIQLLGCEKWVRRPSTNRNSSNLAFAFEKNLQSVPKRTTMHILPFSNLELFAPLIRTVLQLLRPQSLWNIWLFWIKYTGKYTHGHYQHRYLWTAWNKTSNASCRSPNSNHFIPLHFLFITGNSNTFTPILFK